MKRDIYASQLQSLIDAVNNEWDLEKLEDATRDALKKIADKRHEYKKQAFADAKGK